MFWIFMMLISQDISPNWTSLASFWTQRRGVKCHSNIFSIFNIWKYVFYFLNILTFMSFNLFFTYENSLVSVGQTCLRDCTLISYHTLAYYRPHASYAKYQYQSCFHNWKMWSDWVSGSCKIRIGCLPTKVC